MVMHEKTEGSESYQSSSKMNSQPNSSLITSGEAKDVVPDRAGNQASWIDGTSTKKAELGLVSDPGSLKTQEFEYKNSFENDPFLARKISKEENNDGKTVEKKTAPSETRPANLSQ